MPFPRLLAGPLLIAALAGCGDQRRRAAAESPTPAPTRTASATATPEPPLPPGRRIAFRSSDGKRLHGMLRPAGRRAPGIVLVHQYNGGPGQWDPIVGTLHEAGFATLAYTSRDPAELDETLLARDVRGAVAALRRRPEVDGRRIGLLGASIGASAVAYAIGVEPTARVRAGVGLSPSESAELIDAGTRRRFRPHDLLLISDAHEASDVDYLRQDAHGKGITRYVSPDGGHGVLQLEVPAARRRLLDWLRERVAG